MIEKVVHSFFWIIDRIPFPKMQMASNASFQTYGPSACSSWKSSWNSSWKIKLKNSFLSWKLYAGFSPLPKLPWRSFTSCCSCIFPQIADTFTFNLNSTWILEYGVSTWIHLENTRKKALNCFISKDWRAATYSCATWGGHCIDYSFSTWNTQLEISTWNLNLKIDHYR